MRARRWQQGQGASAASPAILVLLLDGEAIELAIRLQLAGLDREDARQDREAPHLRGKHLCRQNRNRRDAGHNAEHGLITYDVIAPAASTIGSRHWLL